MIRHRLTALGSRGLRWFNGPAGESGGPKPPPDRDPFEPRGPRPPEPPPEHPSSPRPEIGHPLFRVCFYLGTVFILLNVVGLIGLVVYSQVVGSGEQEVADLATDLGTSGLLALYAISAPFAIAWTVFFRRVLQRRSFTSLGLDGRRWLPRSALGWILGVAASGLVLLLGTATGVYEPRLPSEPVRYGALFLLFLGFLLQGGTEEIIVRGYAQKNMVEWRAGKRSLGWILVFPSLIFALAHVTNPETSAIASGNTFLLGLALGAAVLAQGNLWGAIGFHAGWNFALAGIWSLPVSGMVPEGWLTVTEAENLPEWARHMFGGGYGPEGGLIVTLMAVFAISILLPRAMDQWPRDRWGVEDD